MSTKNRTILWLRLGTPFLVVTLILVGARIILADPPVTTSTSYRIFRDVEAGAGLITSGSYKMTGIVGEATEVGWVTSTSYKLRSGYGFLGGGPDLRITKAITPTTAAPGQAITYTLTFSNAGSGTATSVVITDTIPVSVTVTSVISSGVAITDTGASPPYVWNMQDLAQDEGGVITITGVLSDPLAAGTFTNTAEIGTTSVESNPNNNSAAVGVTHCSNLITVNNNGDSGPGSLRQAMDDLCAGGTIDFASNVSGTITLASALPTITQDLTITGPGADVLAVSGADSYRVFHITGGTVTISGLTITQGYPDTEGALGYHGGGFYIANPAVVTLRECAITHNTLPSDGDLLGAGIYSDGDLTLERCTVSDNDADDNSGGGLYLFASESSITASTISSNSANFGAGIYNDGADVDINGATVTNNTAATDDGGIVVDTSGIITLIFKGAIKMNHKKCQTIFLCVSLTLISVLLLAWPPLLMPVGADLPPRKPPSADQPPGDDDDDKPVGAFIVLQVPSAPAGVWTVVQWQDSAGGWHDIAGWSGTLDEDSRKMWWVAAKDFDTGPFRWVVYQGQGGKLLATSEWFYLPTFAGETAKIEMSLVSSPTKTLWVSENPKGLREDESYIELHVCPTQAGLWTIVQWQDSAGGWHDIEGWSGTLDEGSKRVWWVAPAAFGTGPFRWLVYQGQGGKLLATSDSFYLPDAAAKKLRVEVSLSQ